MTAVKRLCAYEFARHGRRKNDRLSVSASIELSSNECDVSTFANGAREFVARSHAIAARVRVTIGDTLSSFCHARVMSSTRTKAYHVKSRWDRNALSDRAALRLFSRARMLRGVAPGERHRFAERFGVDGLQPHARAALTSPRAALR
jgi:hypothetical protein